MSCKRLVLAVAVVAMLGALGVPADAEPGAQRTTQVSQRFTFSLFAPDDICGPNAAEITFWVRNQVLHSTEEPNGRFNVQYTQTGTYHVDFVDPALPDQTSQYTESVHHVLTPGETEVFNLAFHDFPNGIRIWERIHVTMLGDARLTVKRVVFKFTGCD